MLQQQFLQRSVAELLRIAIQCFGDAVAVKQQPAAGGQINRGFLVIIMRNESQHHPPDIQLAKILILVDQHRRIMAGVAIGQPVSFGIEDAIEHGDKFPGAGAAEHQRVGVQHAGVRCREQQRLAADGRLHVRHQHRCRQAFTGNIGHADRQTVLVDIDKIIIIASHLLGGDGDAGNIIPGWLGRFLGQQIQLDLVGHAHLFAHDGQGLFFHQQAGVLDHLGRLGGDDRQQPLLVDGKSFITLFVEHGDDADHLLFGQ